jgi:OmcA/MtrC family decaheme c-type cytochrome
VNFTTGANHGGIIAQDNECLICHGPNSTLLFNGKGLKTEAAHVIPELEAAKQFKFEVVRIDTVSGNPVCAAGVKACTIPQGEIPRVTLKVSNPTTGALYKLTDPWFTNTIPCTPTPPATTCTGSTAARLRARIAWTTQNYTSPGSGSTPGQPIQIDFSTGATANADGTYTKAAAAAISTTPVLIGTSGVVFVEGRAIVNVAPAGQPAEYGEIGVTSSDPLYFPMTSAAAVPRRAIVNVQKCNDCHKSLSFHGDNRNNQTELCATCHNPEFTTGTTQADATPLDFKVLIHGIHAATYKFGTAATPIDFTGVGYPGELNNCEGCHRPDTYYPVDSAQFFASSIFRGASASTPADDLAISTNVAACSGCHTSSIAKAHMQQNGGVIMPTDRTSLGAANQIKAATGATIAPAETCVVCHGKGSAADVKEAHGVASFTFR